MIRRSRGYAPLPYLLSGELPGQVLGIGGELKNTFCVGKNGLFYPSPYIGDMEDVRTVNALRESVTRLEPCWRQSPLVACDLHPKYNTAVAEELGLPVLRCSTTTPTSSPAWRKTTIRAGHRRVLRRHGLRHGRDHLGRRISGVCDGFARLGSIHPFLQVGGDASAREGWRIAAAMLHDLYGGTRR
jgi:hydrogenase maturation protein HypF